MNTTGFDSLTKDLATSTTRRRALAGLGALALGGAGVVRLSAAPVSAEDARRRCIDRCTARGGTKQLRQRRERCRRKCENR